uniref:Uncharacterized protein n=1 Tax=Schizaphis graminum TaxID=13262 RepID=A0A2S2PBW9_SCHGA
MDLYNLSWNATCGSADDFTSLLGIVYEETKRIILAIMSLLSVLFSIVIVTARLAEYILNAMLVTADDALMEPQTCSVILSFFKRPLVRSIATAVTAIFLWWLYVVTLIRPVYLEINWFLVLLVRNLCAVIVATFFG